MILHYVNFISFSDVDITNFAYTNVTVTAANGMRRAPQISQVLFSSECLYTRLAVCTAVPELATHTANPNNPTEIMLNCATVVYGKLRVHVHVHGRG